MTFYWWSHWFWITLFSNLSFQHIAVVTTYPSQEITQQQYNTNQQDNTKKIVTRLYQTSTVSWTTKVPTNREGNTRGENLKLQQVEQINGKTSTEISSKEVLVPAHGNDNNEEYYYDYDATEDVHKKLNLEKVEDDFERKEEVSSDSIKEEHEVDIKRSADDGQNKTSEELKNGLKLLEPSTLEETNNYTNFTDKLSLTSTNTTAAIALNAVLANITTINSTTTNTSDNTVKNTTIPTLDSAALLANTTTQMTVAPPSTPKILKAQFSNLDWFNTVAAQLPASHVTTEVAQEESEQSYKIPFTLENVNKPEDLRREESEHRTRKSKVLSAEYKVNRYINYSSDSKNLLTRSAATTVNDYDSEESNISSEALSVQRAHFMDVGAISAICFTVFGICCTVGTVSIVLYRRRFLNKPQTLSEPDSSVYIDDSTMRVSDNSDEMYSLDNDSFLNSLEAMTIQNYWTDTFKHTKL